MTEKCPRDFRKAFEPMREPSHRAIAALAELGSGTVAVCPSTRPPTAPFRSQRRLR